jgi:hypothetical protein
MKFVQINDREFINLGQVTKVEANRLSPDAKANHTGAPEGANTVLTVTLHYNDHGAHRAALIRGQHAEDVLSHKGERFEFPVPGYQFLRLRVQV